MSLCRQLIDIDNTIYLTKTLTQFGDLDTESEAEGIQIHTHRKPKFITSINYDFDFPGEKTALLYQQATQNGTTHTNSVMNGA